MTAPLKLLFGFFLGLGLMALSACDQASDEAAPTEKATEETSEAGDDMMGDSIDFNGEIMDEPASAEDQFEVTEVQFFSSQIAPTRPVGAVSFGDEMDLAAPPFGVMILARGDAKNPAICRAFFPTCWWLVLARRSKTGRWFPPFGP
ncbi:MAG: hypothetical protein IID52_08920 [Proteobacteria bacterium]|nr:hypothetical protein [Pseudomonadota bacterium]